MKIYLIFFFYIQKLKISFIQNTKKDMKIFLKKKKKKGEKKAQERYKNLT